ncbi:unnamed protein product, partial [Prorocentrum cordatum]
RGALLDVCVLFKASGPSFADSYRVAEALLRRPPDAGGAGSAEGPPTPALLRFEEEREAPGRSLGALLDAEVARAQERGACGLLFLVDDALWHGAFDAGAALRLLGSEDGVYTVHAKLNPRVEYAHPNNKFMRVPRLSAYGPAAASSEDGGAVMGEWLESGLLIYERDQGEYDWNYPWELSASIYRVADVREMLAAVREHFGEAGVGHPNRLEGYGVRLFKQQKVSGATRGSRCACAGRPVVAVVTVNRVQSLFDNPVYRRSEGASGGPEASPEALDAALRAELRGALGAPPAEAAAGLGRSTGLDAGWLRSYLEQRPGAQDAGGLQLPALGPQDAPRPGSILSWPPRPLLARMALGDAYLDSVHVPLVAAPRPRELGGPEPEVSWLMPVLDARASWLEDAFGSIAAQAGMGPGSWELVVVDDCSGSAETLEALGRWASLPQVQVVRLGARAGVAGALNAGWARCRGRFVARLDADDIAHEHRLCRQLAYLEANPAVSILGGGFCTFQDPQELRAPGGDRHLRRYRMPCHPLLARWHMVFSCSLAHPTVTFRRGPDLPRERGPYPEGEEAEDHCLWLGLPLHVQVANVGDVVCFLRRHPGSRTACAARAIRRSSFGAAAPSGAALPGDPLRCGCGGRSAQPHGRGAGGALGRGGRLPGGGRLGRAGPPALRQAQRLSGALDALEALFVRLAAGTADAARGDGAPAPADSRAAALQEYVRASCAKLRGFLAVRSLAAGDLSGGTEMVKLLLRNGGDAGLKSLGALIGAGYSAEGPP